MRDAHLGKSLSPEHYASMQAARTKSIKVEAYYRRGRKSTEMTRAEWYGLTVAEFRQMLHDQGACCAICQRPEVRQNKNGDPIMLAIDHDHESGVVRGLLCHNCNLRLGVVEAVIRDYQLLRMLRYLDGEN